jgi:hypothetical protein
MDKGYRKAIDQRYNVWRSNSNTSSRELSRFSKHLRFLSLQIHQKMHIGTIFHVVALLDLPDFHQQATRSSTLLGMTQEIPKREKMLFHKADATSQCKRSLECNLSLSLSFFFFLVLCGAFGEKEMLEVLKIAIRRIRSYNFVIIIGKLRTRWDLNA